MTWARANTDLHQSEPDAVILDSCTDTDISVVVLGIDCTFDLVLVSDIESSISCQHPNCNITKLSMNCVIYLTSLLLLDLKLQMQQMTSILKSLLHLTAVTPSHSK